MATPEYHAALVATRMARTSNRLGISMSMLRDAPEHQQTFSDVVLAAHAMNGKTGLQDQTRRLLRRLQVNQDRHLLQTPDFIDAKRAAFKDIMQSGAEIHYANEEVAEFYHRHSQDMAAVERTAVDSLHHWDISFSARAVERRLDSLRPASRCKEKHKGGYLIRKHDVFSPRISPAGRPYTAPLTSRNSLTSEARPTTASGVNHIFTAQEGEDRPRAGRAIECAKVARINKRRDAILNTQAACKLFRQAMANLPAECPAEDFDACGVLRPVESPV